MKTRKETRLCVVLEDPIERKVYDFINVDIEQSIQDNGRTIKLFIKPKK